MPGVVIIGAGHAGVQTAVSLRTCGYAGDITLVDGQPDLPYHRPALSKVFLKSDDEVPPLLREESYFQEHNIGLKLGVPVASIDREAKVTTLLDNETLSYDKLVIATGGKARAFPLVGRDKPGVFEIRIAEDARRVRQALATASDVVVIGAGFIGLEFAAIAAEKGKNVTIVDVADRVLGRAVSPVTSAAVERLHRAMGSQFRLKTSVAAIEGDDTSVHAVKLASGEILKADMVIVGVGVVADDRVATQSGLATDDGIVVDGRFLTSDRDIYAIGDVARFDCAFGGPARRYESVTCATDQARAIASDISGTPIAYEALPWFWSDQGKIKLQIVGVIGPNDAFVVRGDLNSGSFSVFALRNERVVAVESVNRAADHAAMRRQLPNSPLTAEMCADESISLRNPLETANVA